MTNVADISGITLGEVEFAERNRTMSLEAVAFEVDVTRLRYLAIVA